jgi:hypothetical protein
MRRSELGSTSTEFRHEEAPAISLIRPGARTSLPNAAHWLSAAPMMTGQSAGRPVRFATSKLSVPTCSHGAATGGNSSDRNANESSRSSAQARARRSKNSVELAWVSSVAVTPVSACSTASRGCMKQSAPANTSG